MKRPQLRRYGPAAQWYDLLSGEGLVYRAGRTLGIEQLRLRSGARVLDVGCGTGLNFPFLRDAVGPSGAVVGVDASEAMLNAARTRITRNGWSNVTVHQGDAGTLGTLLDVNEPFDAALFTYALSIIGDDTAAWTQTLALLRPGARVAVVDLALPTGRAWLLRPLAWLACTTGGVDRRRAPWRRVEADTADVYSTTLRSGHIHVAVGTTIPGSDPRAGPAR